MFSHNAGKAFEEFLQRTVLKGVIGRNVKLLTKSKNTVDFELENVLVEAKHTMRIDEDQLAAIAQGAKERSKDFWYVFVQKPGEATIQKIKDAGGKVGWFLDETDN